MKDEFLKAEANETLRCSGMIVPWSDEKNQDFYACPWLSAFTQFDKELKNANTLILMQDWGDESELELGFNYSVELLEPFFNKQAPITGGIKSDATLRNLYEVLNDSEQIGEVAITNAVWGLRESKFSKTGYLGSAVHKTWFRMWAAVVNEFIRREQNAKKIIFCGEWARDWGAKEFTMLENESAKSYLKHYATWAGDSKIFDGLQPNFEIYFFRHPSASGSWVPRSEARKTPDLQFYGAEDFKW